MTVGFIGFGEAGSSIAQGLREEGVDRIVCFDVCQDNPQMKEKFDAKCASCNAEKMQTSADVCREAEIVFSVAQSNFALDAAKSALDGIGEGLIFIDVSTATPIEKKEMAKLTEEKGAQFVDGAMLGALLKDRHKVAMLFSGSGARAARTKLEPYHMNLEVVEGEPGTATSIKFIRSITAKGLSCLLIESLQAAQAYGVEEIIVNSFLDSYGQEFLTTINGYVSGAIIHSVRREHEMENVVDFLKSENLPFDMADATRKKLAWIGAEDIKSHFPDGDVPRSWRGVLDGWGL